MSVPSILNENNKKEMKSKIDDEPICNLKHLSLLLLNKKIVKLALKDNKYDQTRLPSTHDSRHFSPLGEFYFK